MDKSKDKSIVKQLQHLKGAFKLFGIVTLALSIVLGSLAWVQSSNESSTVYAEENTTTPDATVRDGANQDASETIKGADGLSTEAVVPSNRVSNAATFGWQAVDGVRYYYQEDGTKATGTLRINTADVTFDEQGRWVSSRLDVPYISQLPDMPSGCEVVSVTMMLNFAGVSVSKEEVAARLPYADDPGLGFTGDLYADGYSSYSGIIWPPALIDLVKSYRGSALDLTGRSLDEILAHIEQGRPVSIWFSDGTFDHCVLLTGLSETSAWINDPLEGKDIALELADFLLRWEGNGYRALSY